MNIYAYCVSLLLLLCIFHLGQKGEAGYMVTKTLHPKFCKSALSESKTICATTLEKHTSLLTRATPRLQYSLEILKVQVHAPSVIPELEPTEVYEEAAAQHGLYRPNTAPKPNNFCSALLSL